MQHLFIYSTAFGPDLLILGINTRLCTIIIIVLFYSQEMYYSKYIDLFIIYLEIQMKNDSREVKNFILIIITINFNCKSENESCQRGQQ
jgi:hypothetical protein